MFSQDDRRDPNKLLGFPLTKFKTLAENIDGVQPGFYLLGAESNVGKTAFLTNLTMDVIETNRDVNVIYFSLDDSINYTVYRFISILSGLGINEIRKPKGLPSSDKELLDKKREIFLKMIGNRRLILKDIEKVQHIKQLEAEIKNIADKSNLVVFVDGLYNLEVGERFKSIREENIERARKVKYLVDAFRIPIFATGELRKKTQEQSKDKAPTMHDIMESSKYAYNANIVWMLYGKSDELKSSIPELTLEYAKNKLSAYKGEQKLFFTRSIGKMEESTSLMNAIKNLGNGAVKTDEELD